MPNLRRSAAALLAVLALSLAPGAVVSLTSRTAARTTPPAKVSATQRRASNLADPPSAGSFKSRMMRQMRVLERPKRGNKSGMDVMPGVQEVTTLDDYRSAVIEEADDRMVVVWFYARWCRACRAAVPGLASLVRHHPEVKFVRVPASEECSALHRGLGVPSVPYMHLYHPRRGLVQEQKLTRKHLAGLHATLQDYADSSCSLERSGEWSTDSPYRRRRAERASG